MLNELELGGRRLIILPALDRQNIQKLLQSHSENQGLAPDSRNHWLIGEGLTNILNFTKGNQVISYTLFIII